MANDLLVDAIRGAKPEEGETLRGALDVAQEAPRREELSEARLRAALHSEAGPPAPVARPFGSPEGVLGDSGPKAA